MASKKAPKEEEDVLVMGPDLGDSSRPFYRKNSEGVHVGVLRPVPEGEEPSDDAIAVSYRGPGPVYDVHRVEAHSHSKPATAGYRKGWDRIFGGKATVGQA
jgi:hypothetical protein